VTPIPLAGHGRASLNELARRHGVQLSYTGTGGRQIRASGDTLRALLGALGHAASTAADIRDGLAAEEAHRREQLFEPVVVCPQSGVLSSRLHLSAQVDTEHCEVQIRREDGGLDTAPLSQLVRGAHSESDGRVALELSLDSIRPPVGYHVLVINRLPRPVESMLMVPPRPQRPRSWE